MKWLLVFTVLLAGCQTTPPKDCEPTVCDSFDALVVASMLDDELDFYPHGLKLEFADGTDIETMDVVVDEQTKKTYLIREGHYKGKDCRISRTELVDTGTIILLRMPGITETCSGKNCSHCSFKDGGGCNCQNSLNICEHTITKNRDLLRLR